jgi:UDP-GlcNAc3NAcA epimerase
VLKLLTIVGARPQFIKASAISRAIRNHFQNKICEIILHTGQHYDHGMSDVFFSELGIPAPDFNLGIGSCPRHEQLSLMIKGAAAVMLDVRPDAVLVYGDTNSTLAGALAASALQIPVAHVEAGLRSYNKSMPEETNRVLTDHLSTWLFCPTETAVSNLRREGFRNDHSSPYTADKPCVMQYGDVMYDNALYFAAAANTSFNGCIAGCELPEDFVLMTVHRENNTTDKDRLNTIFTAVLNFADSFPVSFLIPLHPRTLHALTDFLPELHAGLAAHPRICLLPPLSYLDMAALESRARFIITDSGGVQKEAAFYGKKCIVLRSETEWKELEQLAAAEVVDVNMDAIIPYLSYPELCRILLPEGLYGRGDAAKKICNSLLNLS